MVTKAKMYSPVWSPVGKILILQPPLNSFFFSNNLYNMSGSNVLGDKGCNSSSSPAHAIYLLNQQSHRFAKGLLENNNFLTQWFLLYTQTREPRSQQIFVLHSQI